MNLTRGINLQKIADEVAGSSGAEIKVSLSACYIIERKILLTWITNRLCVPRRECTRCASAECMSLKRISRWRCLRSWRRIAKRTCRSTNSGSKVWVSLFFLHPLLRFDSSLSLLFQENRDDYPRRWKRSNRSLLRPVPPPASQFGRILATKISSTRIKPSPSFAKRIAPL